MQTTAAIACVELSKTYGHDVYALHNLTLTLPTGNSFGLLGENGAGKSTLVRLIMGFIRPSSGSIRVLGEERVTRAHARIGYVHERPIFEHRFTGRAYLTYLARLAGIWDAANEQRVNELLALVHLEEAANRNTGTYSKGMLQRLAIAQALLVEPELLILDEPTSGLDPRSQWEVRQIIAALRKQGKTLLICSHYLAEIEALCDSVGILRRGELVLSGAVADLLHAQGVVEITLAEQHSANAVVERLSLQEQVIEAHGNLLRIPDRAQTQVLTTLLQHNVPLHSLHPVSRTLEDVYVNTTQNDTTTGEANDIPERRTTA